MTRTNLFKVGLRTLALTTVCAGLVSIAHAADSQPASIQARTQVTGIALHEGGILYGQLLDAQKQPLAKQRIRIHSQGQLIIDTTTNARGQFGARNLRGGLHTITSSHGTQTVQLWAPQTAPPSASHVATVSPTEGTVVRAQDDYDYERRRRRRKLIALGLAGGGLAWALDYNASSS